VEELVKFQQKLELEIVPKVDESILSPVHFDKMSVSKALILVSKSVSAGLRLLVRAHGFSKEMLTTARFLELCSDWFEIVNSRSVKTAFSLQNDEK
jgi:hypothetical protein